VRTFFPGSPSTTDRERPIGVLPPLSLGCYSVRYNQRIFSALGIGSVAAPWVFCRVLAQVGADWIELDRALADQQRGFGLRGARFIAPFPQGAAALISSINLLCIALTERFHHPTDGFSLLGGDQQVYMVSHERIGVNLAFCCFIRVLFKPIPIIDIIFIGIKTGRAIAAALNKVLAECWAA
jgi:hypothetical protein